MKKAKVIDHARCLDKVRKQIMKASPELKYVRFDLSNIISWDENNKRSRYPKTGQRIVVGFDKKRKDGTVVSKEEKSFISHDYCPYCGKKYND